MLLSGTHQLHFVVNAIKLHIMSLKMYQKPGDRWLCLQSFGLTIKLYKKCLLNHNSVICRSVDTFWKPIHIYFLFSFLFLIVLCLAQRHLLKMYVSFFFYYFIFQKDGRGQSFWQNLHVYSSLLIYKFLCIFWISNKFKGLHFSLYSFWQQFSSKNIELEVSPLLCAKSFQDTEDHNSPQLPAYYYSK